MVCRYDRRVASAGPNRCTRGRQRRRGNGALWQVLRDYTIVACFFYYNETMCSTERRDGQAAPHGAPNARFGKTKTNASQQQPLKTMEPRKHTCESRQRFDLAIILVRSPHQEVVVQLVSVYLDALAKRGQSLLRQWHKKLPVFLGSAEPIPRQQRWVSFSV